MLECPQCGKPIPRRKEKGHREREYCSDLCRQRAWHARNKDKHNLDRIIRKAHERMWNAVEQGIQRETWQDELELDNKLITLLNDQLQEKTQRIELLQGYITFLENKLADKEAEITRLTVLLESQAKRRPR